jgi:TonB family protein
VRGAATGEAAQAAAARPGVPAAGAPPSDTPAREGDPGVVPPVALDQPMPRWIPPSRSTDRQQTFQGVLELLIDAKGTVTSAVVREGIHPRFDAELVKLARGWRFRPATRDGAPTPYLKVVLVRLNPSLR